jgi:hypothetical protein
VIILTVMPALCAILIASTASSLGGSRIATISTTGRATAAAQHTKVNRWVHPHVRCAAAGTLRVCPTTATAVAACYCHNKGGGWSPARRQAAASCQQLSCANSTPTGSWADDWMTPCCLQVYEGPYLTGRAAVRAGPVQS